MSGEDQVNSLKQIASFGLADQMAVGGALFELESILSVPDAARTGWWTMKWWWNQPEVPPIKAFDAAIRSRTGKAASARNWFGYAGIRTLAEIANQEKSLDAVVLARALQGYTLPPDLALDPHRAFFRKADHELMSTVLVGEVHPPRADPFDVFTVRALVEGEQAAGPAADSGCRLVFPTRLGAPSPESSMATRLGGEASREGPPFSSAFRGIPRGCSAISFRPPTRPV